MADVGLPVDETYSPPARVREGALVATREEYDRLVETVSLFPQIAAGDAKNPKTPTPVAAGFDSWLFGDDPFSPRALHEFP